MNKLQFKEFLFEHNPRKIELSFANNLVTHLLPLSGSLTQSLGARCRIIRCEGEVFASTADGAAGKLSAISAACCGQIPGTLYLPTGEQFLAIASKFSYLAQGDGRVITYALEFMETSSGGAAS